MVSTKILNKIRVYKFINREKKRGSIIQTSLKLREEMHIHLDGTIYLGERCQLLCWSKYMSGLKVQDLKPCLKIGNNFHATRNLVIQCADNITIGNDVLVASDVFIIDFNHGSNPLTVSYLDNPLIAKGIKIEDGVWLGNSVIVLPGVTIGKKSIVAAGAVVTRDIPPYCMAAGNPARVIKKYDFETNDWVRI